MELFFNVFLLPNHDLRMKKQFQLAVQQESLSSSEKIRFRFRFRFPYTSRKIFNALAVHKRLLSEPFKRGSFWNSC
jgi:hypothetical protein